MIDDEEAVRGLYRAILEPIGYSVMEASNGGDGLRRFHDSPADVVITDLREWPGDYVAERPTIERSDFATRPHPDYAPYTRDSASSPAVTIQLQLKRDCATDDEG